MTGMPGNRWSASNSSGFYRWQGKQALPAPCRLKLNFFNHVIEVHDAYTFGSSISDHDLYLFSEGRLEQAYRMLGAHHMEVQGVWGVRFAVWAPNAERVSVVGDFNGWDGRVMSDARAGQYRCMGNLRAGHWAGRVLQIRDTQSLFRRRVRQDRSLRIEL